MNASLRILLFGATGTIGRATAAELAARGHRVLCPLRPQAGLDGQSSTRQANPPLPDVEVSVGPVTDPGWLADTVFADDAFDVVASCLASRSGEPRDAWAIDYQAQSDILALARQHGIPRMVLLSAICVQKPRLAFQHARLAFERELRESGLQHAIVRPTAYFKSLSGQFARVRRGKPFLVFGDGELTACKPISDADLAAFLAECVEQPSAHRGILPIGGPGPAMTPRQQGLQLFEVLGREPRFKQVPVSLLGGIAAALGVIGKAIPLLAAKAELARIGHYYATESMLVLDAASGRYDAGATPETGQDRLVDYYRRLAQGRETLERSDHSVFRE